MASLDRVLSLLDQMAGLLAAPPASSAPVGRLVDLVDDFCAADLGPSHIASDLDAEKLASKLAALGDRLSRQAVDLARPSSQPGGQPSTTAVAGLPLATLGPLCSAASKACLECLRLATVLGGRLQRGEAYRLCAGLGVVPLVGAALLRRCLQAMPFMAPEEGRSLWWQAAKEQLRAVHVGVRYMSDSSDELAAAWARTAGRPAVVLPWLAAVADMLGSMVGVGVELGIAASSELAGVCSLLLDSECCQGHAAALAAAPAVQAALLGLLLEHVLPCMAESLERAFDADGSGGGNSGSDGSDGGSDSGGGSGSAHRTYLQAASCLAVCYLPSALCGTGGVQRRNGDVTQLLRCVRRVGGAAIVRQASRIARALPLQQEDSQGLLQLYDAHKEAARLVAFASKAADEALKVQAATRGGSAAAAAAASSGVTSAGSATSATALPAERQELRMAMLQLVPHAAAVVLALEADSCCSEEQLGAAVDNYSLFLGRCGMLQCEGVSPSDGAAEQQEAAAVWLAALDASLRLLPFSLQRAAGWQQLGWSAAAGMPGALGILLIDGTSAVFDAARRLSRRPAPSPQSQELLPQLWAAHSAACRTLHWLAQPQQQEALFPGQARRYRDLLLILYNGIHKLLVGAPFLNGPLDGTASDAASSPSPTVRAMCVAHWAAVRAVHPRLADGCGLSVHTCRALLLLANVLPAAVDESLATLLAAVLEPSRSRTEEGREAAETALGTLTHMLRLHAASVEPMPLPLLAGLAAGDLLGRLARQQGHPLASEHIVFCVLLLDGLHSVACEVTEQQQQEEPPQQEEPLQQQEDSHHQQQGQPQQQQQHQLALEQAAAELQTALASGPPLPQEPGVDTLQPAAVAALADVVAGAAEPAQRVAALLLQHCAQPQQVVPDRLAVAQAASARSCANLR
ncbi:hypothetical protein ABPG75_010657 [Micractinium tetrahymenae]